MRGSGGGTRGSGAAAARGVPAGRSHSPPRRTAGSYPPRRASARRSTGMDDGARPEVPGRRRRQSGPGRPRLETPPGRDAHEGGEVRPGRAGTALNAGKGGSTLSATGSFPERRRPSTTRRAPGDAWAPAVYRVVATPWPAPARRTAAGRRMVLPRRRRRRAGRSGGPAGVAPGGLRRPAGGRTAPRMGGRHAAFAAPLRLRGLTAGIRRGAPFRVPGLRHTVKATQGPARSGQRRQPGATPPRRPRRSAFTRGLRGGRTAVRRRRGGRGRSRAPPPDCLRKRKREAPCDGDERLPQGTPASPSSARP